MEKGQRSGIMFLDEVLDLEPDFIGWRRHLHQFPELSFEETRTTEYLIEKMKDLPGVTLNRPTRTGVVAVLRGTSGEGGPCIAFRADIDALPIQEETDLPFASVNPGVMHACGHDGHAAIQLAAVQILSKMRDRLCGEVRFLFQHAEEKPPGGAVEMLNAGVMEGVEELYGLHLSSSFPTGTFGVRSGALTAATDRIDITIKGSEGHSAFPELCVDPVVTAAEVITALQTIVSRKIKAAEPAVLSICRLEAGNVYNIIPEEVHMTGASRTFSPETREKLPDMIEQIVRGVCGAHGASYSFDFRKGYASVINDEVLTRQSRERIAAHFGESAVLDIGPLMPGEDFSSLQKNCPGFFVELGAGNPEKGCDVPHHNRLYKLDEDALKYGVEYICRTVLEKLGINGPEPVPPELP